MTQMAAVHLSMIRSVVVRLGSGLCMVVDDDDDTDTAVATSAVADDDDKGCCTVSVEQGES